MTEEEIQKEAKEIVNELVRYCDALPEHREYAASKLRAVVRTTRREAIEECAKTAEQWGASEDEPTDPDVAFSCLAAALRALRRPPSE